MATRLLAYPVPIPFPSALLMKILPRLLVLAATFTVALTLSAKPLTVGFAQTGAESAWRTANTDSLRNEAEKRGINLKFVDGQGKQENQIRAIRGFIAQQVNDFLRRHTGFFNL